MAVPQSQEDPPQAMRRACALLVQLVKHYTHPTQLTAGGRLLASPLRCSQAPQGCPSLLSASVVL